MDDGRVEKLVELGDGVAEVRERAPHEREALLPRAARLHAAPERFPGNVLHHHHEVAVSAVTLHHARQVREPHAAPLRREDGLVRAAQTGLAADALAHERPQHRAVLPHEGDALGGLERALLEHGVHAVAGVALEGVKIAGEFVFCVHAPILAERGQRHRADPAGRSPVLSGGPRPPPAPQASRWSSRQSDRAPR